MPALTSTSGNVSFFKAPVSFPPGFAVTGHTDGQKNSRICVNEVLPDGLAFNEGARGHVERVYAADIPARPSETRLFVQVCVPVTRSWC